MTHKLTVKFKINIIRIKTKKIVVFNQNFNLNN